MNINEEIEKNIQDINSLGFDKKINLNAKETARVLGVSPSSIENYIKQGIGIDYLEIGKRRLFPKRAIAEFLVRRIVKTA